MRSATKFLFLAAIGVGAVSQTACTTAHLLRPVGRGNTRVNLSLGGGPLIRFAGAPVPLPVTTVGVAHGVSDLVDVHADLHPTAAFFGSAGADVGMAFHPIPTHRAGLTLGWTLSAFGNGRDATVFADLWFGTSWRVANFLWLGAGMHNGLRALTSDATLRSRSPWAPVPFVQIAIQPRGARFGFEIEARWFAPNENGLVQFAPYYPIGDRGALGVTFGFNYQLPGGVR